MKIGKHQTHSAADIFPMMNAADLRELAGDIKVNGLIEPICTYQGRVIDGRNRYRACLSVCVKPHFLKMDEEIDDPVAFVVSMNLHRRHLDESQRAMVAARVANIGHGGDRSKGSIDLLTSQTNAAEKLNVSTPSVKRAQKVLREGASDLVSAVESGDIAVSAAAKVAELPKAEQKEVVRKVKTGKARNVREAMRQRNYSQKQKQATTLATKGLMSVVYADPPWEYSNSGFATNQSRVDGGAAAGHYPTMPTSDICALPVANHTTKDAVCFLWVTNPLLEDGLRVLKSWGFEYKTNRVWTKDRGTYLGFYVDGHHELLLIGVKGSMLPAKKVSSLIVAPRQEHSRKPDSVYKDIETMYPGLGYLELFARRKRKGWTQWGNEKL